MVNRITGKPSTNGKHTTNGQHKTMPAYPSPNGTHKTTATVNGRSNGEGRDTSGRFAPGNKFAMGNPYNRRLARMKQVLAEAVSEDEMRALGRQLYEQAMAGQIEAAKLVLEYCVGKPPKGIDPDDCDLDEWKRIYQSPNVVQLFLSAVEAVDPQAAIAMLQESASKDTQGIAKKIAGLFANPSVSTQQQVKDINKARAANHL